MILVADAVRLPLARESVDPGEIEPRVALQPVAEVLREHQLEL